MGKFAKYKEIFVIFFIVGMFFFVSYLSFFSIQQLQGNARVVNYVGIVRGATQKLVKMELNGKQDDTLIDWLDSIIMELITGNGPNDLVILQDLEYLGYMRRVQNHWGRIKNEIQAVRDGSEQQLLFDSSEEYFQLVDQTVTVAEQYSEKQVKNTMYLLIGVNIVFVAIMLIGLIYYLRTATLKRKTEMLNKIAYFDPLAQMNNRASCEREIAELSAAPPEDDVAVLMFDMNNLKLVNDRIGHQGGDRVIAEFSRIIRTEAKSFGFIGRYGGDEFLAVFKDADMAKVELFLKRINEKIQSYNMVHVNELEKLSFAVGYALGNLNYTAISELINEADRRMYIQKRKMKENKDTV